MLKRKWLNRGLALILLSVILSGCSDKEEAKTIEETEIESSEEKKAIEQEKESEQVEIVEEDKEENTPQEEKVTKEPESEENEPAETETNAVEEVVKNVSYTNKELGFSLSLPSHWEGVLTIDQDSSWDEELDHAVNFYYQPDDSIKSAVFSIVVYDEEMNPDEWYQPFGELLAIKNGKTYGYIMPGEPAAELFEPNNEEKLDFATMMMNDDVPEIIQTIRFQ